jgi:three-Cys-motif partner protein
MVRRPPGQQRFGGDWTEQKLDVVQKYLGAYTTALKNQPFRKLYIDAFAGTGYREERREEQDDEGQALLFPDLADEAPQRLLEGSARRALTTQPAFDEYIFVEKSLRRSRQLELLKTEFPDLAPHIEIQRGEANAIIQRLCAAPWISRRAVLFLDPYGMQVEWATIEAIAGTQAIDLWLLFPLGIGVNRLVTRSGSIPESWQVRLNLLLGTGEWYEEFYRIESESTLFGSDTERVVKASVDVIGRYFLDRLESVFAGVADNPAVLRNSTRNPLYLLCFAVANPRGKATALKIAQHILKGVE